MLHVDVVFSRLRSLPASVKPPSLGIAEVAEEIGASVPIFKRLRKLETSPEVWAEICARMGSRVPDLRRELGRRLADEVTVPLLQGIPPDPESSRRARARLVRRRALSCAGVGGLARGGSVAVGRAFRPAGVFLSLSGVDGAENPLSRIR